MQHIHNIHSQYRYPEDGGWIENPGSIFQVISDFNQGQPRQLLDSSQHELENSSQSESEIALQLESENPSHLDSGNTSPLEADNLPYFESESNSVIILG